MPKMPLRNRAFPPPRRQQHGFILITTLIFLVVLTLFVLSSVRTGTLQLRMVGNLADRGVAFENADLAIRAGELQAYGYSHNLLAFTADCNKNGNATRRGLCLDLSNNYWKTYQWNDNASMTVPLKNSEAVSQPRFYVEWMNEVKKNILGQELKGSGGNVYVFSVVGRAQGKTNQSLVIAEEIVAIPKPSQQQQ
ncbi:pilus assembly PilX family protein [Chitinimonas lacunae]|uniref:PilX N-terminal domain-containing pilus assembly protein n=1 Tax=Chitinimonas lacunae TaxID=1963018 RepID=A0ABV8MQG9_9NEIS